MMGKRLYINLIKVNPKNGNFPINTLLGYNLEFIRGSKQHDLESLQLLSPNTPESIMYGELKISHFSN